ncbi:MAG: PD-(D/E)XK nuclease family protein [Pseudomonadota bacterium]
MTEDEFFASPEHLEKLGCFFTELRDPLELAHKAGLFCDPWAASKLEDKEVRNSYVLSWWLNPHESHGLGKTFLVRLLQFVNEKRPHILPCDVNNYCRVGVESTPAGNWGNRVDIEIDADNFYVVIEVKINASSDKKQLERYCIDAAIKSQKTKRPWMLLFLTRQGKNPLEGNQNVFSISWRDISFLLYDAATKHTGESDSYEAYFVRRLAQTFCSHIYQF